MFKFTIRKNQFCKSIIKRKAKDITFARTIFKCYFKQELYIYILRIINLVLTVSFKELSLKYFVY